MPKDKEPLAYALELIDWQQLQAIKRRLYDNKPLSPDQRRDLANAMDAIMHKAVAMHE